MSSGTIGEITKNHFMAEVVFYKIRSAPTGREPSGFLSRAVREWGLVLVEDRSAASVVVLAHLPVPVVVQGSDHDREADQRYLSAEDQKVFLQGVRVAEQVRDPGEGDGNRPARQVVEREAVEEPGATRVPPHVLLAEARDPVVRVDHEPQEVPGDCHHEVVGERLRLVCHRPRLAACEAGVDDDEREDEHPAVVAGERLSAEQEPVDAGGDTLGAVPGWHLLGPSVLALRLDFETSESE